MADKYRIPSESDLATATEVTRLIYVDVDANSNKYWVGYCLANGEFYCEYGRVQDAKGDCRHDYYTTKDLKGKSNEAHLTQKIKEKARKGYVEQKVAAVLGAPAIKTSSKTVNNSELKRRAADEIKGDSETKKLVTWLAEVNIHNITSSTNIAYNASTGSFTTPLGTLVTDSGLVEARDVLSSLTPFVTKSDWENSRYKRMLGDYLQLIPQDVGRNRGWHSTILAGTDSLQQQNDIIDALEAALTTSAKTVDGQKADKQDSVFNVSLDVVKGDLLKKIREKYKKEKGGHSDVKDYDIKTAWAVNISTVRESFRKDGMKIGNVQQLYHGSKASNLLSILKGGLVIPRSSDPHVCGRMWNDGIYMSSQSTKALRYATGAWTRGGNTQRIFMFICEAGLGKQHIPSNGSSWGYRMPSGYDSCWAKAGVSGVKNHEQVVYRTSQVDLLYLLEFTK